MDPITYKIIHLIGLATVALGTGGMIAGGENKKLFSIWQGIGLVIMLVSGFGLLAKLQLGFPHFAVAKLILWVLLGMLPLVVRKLKVPLWGTILATLTIIGLLAWLGVMKPALW